MSKAMLIIDMPDCCEQCVLRRLLSDGETHICHIMGFVTDITCYGESENERKNNCPLKPYTGFKIDLDKHDLNQMFNSIYLSLEAAKDMLNYAGDIKEAIRHVDKGKEKLEKFSEKVIEYD